MTSTLFGANPQYARHLLGKLLDAVDKWTDSFSFIL